MHTHTYIHTYVHTFCISCISSPHLPLGFHTPAHEGEPVSNTQNTKMRQQIRDSTRPLTMERNSVTLFYDLEQGLRRLDVLIRKGGGAGGVMELKVKVQLGKGFKLYNLTTRNCCYFK